MQYIPKNESADDLNDVIAKAFESWVGQQDFVDLTQEQEDALRLAFEAGYNKALYNLA